MTSQDQHVICDARVLISRYAVGDRVRYSTGEEWVEKEAPTGVITQVNLHMFRQGPGFWSIQYRITFDHGWPEKPLSEKIFEITTFEGYIKPVSVDDD